MCAARQRQWQQQKQTVVAISTCTSSRGRSSGHAPPHSTAHLGHSTAVFATMLCALQHLLARTRLSHSHYTQAPSSAPSSEKHTDTHAQHTVPFPRLQVAARHGRLLPLLLQCSRQPAVPLHRSHPLPSPASQQQYGYALTGATEARRPPALQHNHNCCAPSLAALWHRIGHISQQNAFGCPHGSFHAALPLLSSLLSYPVNTSPKVMRQQAARQPKRQAAHALQTSGRTSAKPQPASSHSMPADLDLSVQLGAVARSRTCMHSAAGNCRTLALLCSCIMGIAHSYASGYTCKGGGWHQAEAHGLAAEARACM